MDARRPHYALRNRTGSPWIASVPRRLQGTHFYCAAFIGFGALALAACGFAELDATKRLTDNAENPEDRAPPPPDDAGSLGGAGDDGTPPGVVSPDSNPPIAPTDTLTVSDGYLRDHCGAPVLLRGVSEMVVWAEYTDAQRYISEIAQTGANALRVVWMSDGDPLALGALLDVVRSEKMVALVEFHDRTDLGLAESMDQMVAGWVDETMVATLNAHQRDIIVELGTGVPRQPTAEWETVFIEAVGQLRQAGLKMPVAVRAPVWQNGFETAVNALSRVVRSDPLSNTLVATFFWSGTESAFRDAHRAIMDAGMVPFIAEFSGYQSGTCPLLPTDVQAILAFSLELDVGWFAWSWGGVPNAPCPQISTDMTTDGTVAGLIDWGRTVALADPNGISRTSVPLATADRSTCSE